jgi:hypothetical protein
VDAGVLGVAGWVLAGAGPAGDWDKKVLGVADGDVLTDDVEEGDMVSDAGGVDEETAGEVVSAGAVCDWECAAGDWWAVPARPKPAAADAARSTPVIKASASGRRKRCCGRRPAPPGWGWPTADPGTEGGFPAVTV